ncbi:MAG: SDR family oxidoreductase [Melioribacteraceae bacterium]|nr:SDR family oxidoreductase [Melioribacteraceae bacterium]
MNSKIDIRKILVTGSEGYIGSVLMPLLVEKGYEITGLDTCFYSAGNFDKKLNVNYNLLKKDIRDISEDTLENFDAVIHLAALSNDPLGMLDEKLTFDINYTASLELAKMARKVGVKRFVFSSSCSLYGYSNNVLTEKDIPNPQTAYGKSKIMAEREISKLADDHFSPVFLRNATAFGISPRMRFDLVVNSLTGFAKTKNEIRILGDGTPWRPLVHVNDISNAIITVLRASKSVIHNQAFNVGSNKENYQIKTIAECVKKQYSNCEVRIMQKMASDTRNYSVSFNKLNSELGFNSEISLEEGIAINASCYEKIMLNKAIFESSLYTRLKQIELLIDQKKIDKKLRWINNEF